MNLPPAFAPFIKGAPCAVATRLIAEYVVDDAVVRQLFQRHAVTQYERKVAVEHLVQVMLDVSCGLQTSVRSAFLRRWLEEKSSLTAFYGKLDRVDPEVGMALVDHVGRRATELIQQFSLPPREPIPGRVTYVLDGNALAGSEHRLKPLRGIRAAALPGKSLVLMAYATGVVTQVVLWEDAHSQERKLLPQIHVPSHAHVMADRNFCVRWFLLEIGQAESCFTIRYHKACGVRVEGKRRKIGRCETGMVYERELAEFDEAGRSLGWRAVFIELDQPTREGETEITLLTNLPADEADALVVAAAYRERWTVERLFQRLTDHLHCEAPTLAQPRAALFAFAVALTAGNLLAILIAALEAAHGRESAEELSYHYLVDEVARHTDGMLLALPAPQWSFIRDYTPREAAKLLRTVVSHADVRLLRKTRRGVKKPRRTPNCTNVRHVSTKRELNKMRSHAC